MCKLNGFFMKGRYFCFANKKNCTAQKSQAILCEHLWLTVTQVSKASGEIHESNRIGKTHLPMHGLKVSTRTCWIVLVGSEFMHASEDLFEDFEVR